MINKDKIIACFLLHAVGDTIGFRDSIWEFNGGTPDMTVANWNYTYEIISQFIELGGINDIDLTDWMISDDTLLHIMLSRVIIKNEKNKNNNPIEIADAFAQSLKKNGRHNLSGRYPGNITTKAVEMLEAGEDWKTFAYRKTAGGSGASMRTPIIGIMYNGEKNRQKLIEIALETSRVTHNNAIGYLGGITTALFSAFIIEGKKLEQFPFLLIDILESGIIENYLKKTRGIKEYSMEKDIFINKWRRYIEDRFEKDKNGEYVIVYNKSMRNLSYRMRYYYENYGYKESTEIFPGSGGDDSVIISYDCLLDSRDSWEKLVFYTMLSVGDSDTLGCIAGSWYGLLYGLNKVPKNNYKNLEYKKEIIETAQNTVKILYKTQ